MLNTVRSKFFGLVVAALLPVGLAGCGEISDQATAQEGWAPLTFFNASYRDFTSEITGHDHRLLVYVPDTPAPESGYPVVYMIDGNFYFGSGAEIIRLQGGNFVEQAIVVGIGYPTNDIKEQLLIRRKDLAYEVDDAYLTETSSLNAALGKPKDPVEMWGGLLKYVDMLEKEVKPMVRALAPVDEDKEVLFGHSLGGLTTTHVLLNTPDAFDAYIIAAPSLWWHRFQVMGYMDGFEERIAKLEKPISVHMSVGGMEEEIPDAPQLRSMPDAVREALVNQIETIGMVRSLRKLSDGVNEVADKTGKIKTATVVFEDENHPSVAPISLNRGIRHTLAK